MDDLLVKIAQAVFSQCGVVAAIGYGLAIAMGIYSMKEVARIRGELDKEREAREKDRTQAMAAAGERARAFDSLAMSHGKITDAVHAQGALLAELKSIVFLLANRRDRRQ